MGLVKHAMTNTISVQEIIRHVIFDTVQFTKLFTKNSLGEYGNGVCQAGVPLPDTVPQRERGRRVRRETSEMCHNKRLPNSNRKGPNKLPRWHRSFIRFHGLSSKPP